MRYLENLISFMGVAAILEKCVFYAKNQNLKMSSTPILKHTLLPYNSTYQIALNKKCPQNSQCRYWPAALLTLLILLMGTFFFLKKVRNLPTLLTLLTLLMLLMGTDFFPIIFISVFYRRLRYCSEKGEIRWATRFSFWCTAPHDRRWCAARHRHQIPLFFGSKPQALHFPVPC